MSEEIIEVRKIGENLYEYDLKLTFQTTLDSLNSEKATLDKRVTRVDHIISEIGKLG